MWFYIYRTHQFFIRKVHCEKDMEQETICTSQPKLKTAAENLKKCKL